MSAAADYAWAAGFLDGEGSFIMATRQGEDYRRPAITAGQIDRRPLDKLTAVLGGGVSGPVSQTSAGNGIYRWYLRSAVELRRVILRLLPHLTIKSERALLVLELARHTTRGGRPLTAAEREARAEIYERFVALAKGDGSNRL